jgi:hypothetical protein
MGDYDQRFVTKFWSHIEKPGADDCWTWKLSCTAAGYGQIWCVDTMKYAHRIAYELIKGPIPTGMEVLHACDNPPCANPAHLRVGTHADNMRDMAVRGRQGKTPRGPCPRRKLTPEQVRAIRANAQNETLTAQAQRYVVAFNTIWGVAHRLTYKDVV